MYTGFDKDLNASDLNFKDFEALNKAKKGKNKKNDTYYFSARLGEVINNGIKYFGKHKISDNYTHTADFICPKCNELFRANTKKVQDGSIKDCGCTR